MSKKIGVAIIGAGAIASVHIDAFAGFGDQCAIVAVCDTFVDKAEKLIRDKGLTAAALADYHEALAMDQVDAVSICLPPSLHATVTVEAARAGKHVLCEKPMAASLEECDMMIRAADESGTLLSIVAQNRYKTPNQKVRRLIADGVIGRVQFATVNSLWWRGENYYDIWWRGTWEKETGGCVANHAVHHIDLLQWILGMPDKVNAVLANVGHHNSQCEDVGIAALRYPEMIVELTTSLVTHSEAQELLFQGEKGSVSVPWGCYACKPLPNGFPQEDAANRDAIAKAYAALPELDIEGHPAQIRNFLRAIRGEEELLIDGREGRKSVELITAVYEAACTEQTVKLPLLPEDDFYQKGGIARRMPHFHEKTRSVDNLLQTQPITLGRDVGK